MSNQLNIQDSRLFGSLVVSDSIIRIDLAALGINSLNITVSIPSQGNILESRTANNIVLVLEVQRHQTSMIVTRTTPITKVYYRRKFRKNKSSHANMRNNQMQEERAQIFPEPVEDYMVIHEQLDEEDYSTRKPLRRKRKCSTPVSAKKLRRSDRLNKALDGHKPKQASPPKGQIARNKSKGKKVSLQSSIRGKLLFPPSCSDAEFPDLSIIKKHTEIGNTYPEIPIVEIQKVATHKCRITPSEVTTELLLASKKKYETNGGRSSVEVPKVVINE